MPKHNDYPHKFTIRKVVSSGGKNFRVQAWFPKKDTEIIFEAAKEGKELVFKITSDPTTLKENSIVLNLEPIVIGKEAYELYQTILDSTVKKPKEDFSDQDYDDFLDKVIRYIRPELEEKVLEFLLSLKTELQKIVDVIDVYYVADFKNKKVDLEIILQEDYEVERISIVSIVNKLAIKYHGTFFVAFDIAYVAPEKLKEYLSEHNIDPSSQSVFRLPSKEKTTGEKNE